jgi:hypothetical protein
MYRRRLLPCRLLNLSLHYKHHHLPQCCLYYHHHQIKIACLCISPLPALESPPLLAFAVSNVNAITTVDAAKIVAKIMAFIVVFDLLKFIVSCTIQKLFLI